MFPTYIVYLLLILKVSAIEENITESNSSEKSGILDAVKFMKKFGYIPKGDETADFIYSPTSLSDKIKLVQKYGAIPQTGTLDKATLKLMQTPRCGVHDLENVSNRPKRYIVGGSGWNKRKLTYNVANWSPKLWSMENVRREVRKAFDAWTKYSYLQFEEVNSSTADIVIFFASYHHNDDYPFDGQGGILAHAYYPHEFGHFGGDIHFDESESWTIRPKDEHSGLDFFTVAVHEIGHSLGLAHSPVPGSIMFPYYKGYSDNFALDYDDIMGMWELYIKRRLDGDDEFFKTSSTTVATPKTSSTSYPTTATTTTIRTTLSSTKHPLPRTTTISNTQNDGIPSDDETIIYHGDSETVDEHKRRTNGGKDEKDYPSLDPVFPTNEESDREREREEEERRIAEEAERFWEEELRKWEEERRRIEEEDRRRIYEEERRRQIEEERRRNEWERRNEVTTPQSTLPDLCYGGFDAITSFRGKILIFKNGYVWRYSYKTYLDENFPVLAKVAFPGISSQRNITAAYERLADNKLILFIGDKYYIHDGSRNVEEVRPVTDYGLPSRVKEVDAALFWPKNNRTYIFSRNLYWRKDDIADSLDSGYPRGIERWHGIPKYIDGAFTDSKGDTYFFKGDYFWEYDNYMVAPTRNSPRNIVPEWVSC